MSNKIISIEFDTREIEKKFKEYGEKASKILEKSLILLAEGELKNKSQSLVPLDEGPLKNSYTSTKPKVNSGKDFEITVGYNKKYATRLHEDMSLNIKRQGRSQKYLEKPLKELNLGREIANNMRQIR